MSDRVDQADPLKVQITIGGYAAWALREYQLQTTQSPAKYAEAALERYIIGDASFFSSLGITVARFRNLVEGGEVVRMRRRQGSSDEPSRD